MCMLEKLRELWAVVRSGACVEVVGEQREGEKRTDDDDDDELEGMDGMRSGNERGTGAGVGGIEAVLM